MIDLEQMIAPHYPEWFQGVRAPLTRSLLGGFSRWSRLPEINQFLADSAHQTGFAFVEAALRFCDVRFTVDDVEVERIPERGGVLIVSNHPLGGVDALLLLKLIGRVRRDVKIIANEVLMALPGLAELLLPLRVFGGGASRAHLEAVRTALAEGQAVIVFPAGEVSRLGWRGIRDREWRNGALRLARQAKAAVLPVRIEARNSIGFYGGALLHPSLGTALLLREVTALRGSRVDIRIGHASPAEDAGDIGALQRRCLELRHDGDRVPKLATLAPRPDLRDIRREIAALPLLGETGDGKRIHAGRLAADSALLAEVARLREHSFRAVGEGSGKSADTDRFDAWYDQIILWDDQTQEIVGGYRVAPCKAVLTERGIAGLYTSTLFEFSPAFTEQLGDAMELGRSFVVPEHWGTRSLDYLWLGIGAYLRQRPDIRRLFGPVSISAQLPVDARAQLVDYYRHHHGVESATVRARRRWQQESSALRELRDLPPHEAFRLLRDNLAKLGTRVPTLYKQYTDLCEPGGVQFLDFGVDPDFSDSIDGLVWVDLEKMLPRKRQRYITGAAGRTDDGSGSVAVGAA